MTHETEQLDFFIASPSDAIPVKSQQDLMMHACFSLSKKKRTAPIEHQIKDSFVRITPNKKHGCATIWDYDVILFVISQWVNSMNKGRTPPKNIIFTPYEYFRWKGVKGSGREYERLRASLERLHTTQIETNIRQGRKKRYHSFYLVGSWMEEMTDGRVEGLRIDLSAWLHKAVVDNKKLILTLDDEYFELTGGLQRWLYLYVRKASGKQATGWRESFCSIYKKSASSGSFKLFKSRLRGLIKKQGLPHYLLQEYESINGESYLLMTRHGALYHNHPEQEIEYICEHKCLCQK